MMHRATFDYLKPTQTQLQQMEQARTAALAYSDALQELLPEGPDKTYVMRKIREASMWAMISISRNPDGSPRES